LTVAVPSVDRTRLRACALVVCLAWSGSGLAADCSSEPPPGPRLLVLALDGVPLRIVEAARARGAFAGWPEPAALVSTFPSMTNVAFTAMLELWGARSIAGYETRYFDIGSNHLVSSGGPSEYDWKKLFEVIGESFAAKRALYMSPGRRARKVIELVEAAVLDHSTPDVVLAHMASTDMLAHLRGDQAMLDVVLEVSAALEWVIPEHRSRFGRDLAVVLLSDHGNTNEKVAYTHGLRDALRAADFSFESRLDEPRSVVVPTYGAVSYGALYLDPALAEQAAVAAVGHESVELAAWVDGDRRIMVLSSNGRASVMWEDTASGRTYAYEVEAGDPLSLLEARARMETLGALDEWGFGPESEWSAAGVDGPYPQALRRLVDSLTGRYVENPATVMLSLGPNYAWGKPSVRFGARMMGGRLEGTHGGLDRQSSLGFLLASDPARQPEGVVAAEDALSAWLGLAGCPPVGGP